MKIAMGPVNIADQPRLLARGLRQKGIDATLYQQVSSDHHPFGYETDKIVQLDKKNRSRSQFDIVENCLNEEFDIFHFWNRSFVFSNHYEHHPGIDMPIYRQYGRNVVYRFTGFDLRTKTDHIERNPYNPWRYGYELEYDETAQLKYIDYIKDTADLLVVQDPEMHQLCPEATVVPRAIDLENFSVVEKSQSSQTTIVHAPSSEMVKGTRFVRAAIESLKSQGLDIEYVEVSGMQHKDAMELYKRADIVIDQLLIGWYGVLTVEAMALGKPVICYIRDGLGAEKLPLVNANPDTIIEELKNLIKDRDRQKELGRQARSYVEQVHAIDVVADKMIAAYQTLVPRTPLVQDRYPMLDHMRHQHSEMATNSIRLQQRVKHLENIQEQKIPTYRRQLRNIVKGLIKRT